LSVGKSVRNGTNIELLHEDSQRLETKGALAEVIVCIIIIAGVLLLTLCAYNMGICLALLAQSC